jgi:predicted PurR-regulated permease PerM
MHDRSPRALSGLRPSSVIRTALLVGILLVIALAAWLLSDVLLLGFAAILFAIVLRSLAGLIERYTPLKHPWSLALSTMVFASIAGAFAFLLGAQIQAQLAGLIDRFPELIAAVGDRIGITDLQQRLENQIEDLSRRSGLVGRIAGYTSGLVAALADLTLVLVAGIYLAVDPRRYRRGVLLLVPRRVRAEAARAFDNAGRALRLWVVGQLVAMAVVGVLTTVGLYLIGMPSALALGFLAGVADFVPFIGPLLAAVPAILVALSEGGSMVFWVIGLYILVQQIESNAIVPLIQRRMVDLPPVLTLFAVLSFGILFGPLGFLLGTPLAVVLYVAVKQLYIQDALGEDAELPGENHDKRP